MRNALIQFCSGNTAKLLLGLIVFGLFLVAWLFVEDTKYKGQTGQAVFSPESTNWTTPLNVSKVSNFSSAENEDYNDSPESDLLFNNVSADSAVPFNDEEPALLFNAETSLTFNDAESALPFTVEPVLPVSPNFVMPNSSVCETPSLSRNSFHIVIAGYDSETCVNHYIWHLGATNADVFVYRREGIEEPAKFWTGPCGISVQEKILVPNFGRDAAAFYDYAIEVYDRPPEAMVFLHGHGGLAHHTSCDAIFSRVHMYYQSLVHEAARGYQGTRFNSSFDGFSDHMISLTSMWNGHTNMSNEFAHPWGERRRFVLGWKLGSWFNFGASKENVNIDVDIDPACIPGTIRGESRCVKPRDVMNAGDEGCNAVLKKWEVPEFTDGFYSCCASFILPGKRLLMYPKGLYSDLRAYLMSPDFDDQWTARACFEYIVYRVFREPALTPELNDMYNLPMDDSVSERLSASGCKDEYLLNHCV